MQDGGGRSTTSSWKQARKRRSRSSADSHAAAGARSWSMNAGHSAGGRRHAARTSSCAHLLRTAGPQCARGSTVTEADTRLSRMTHAAAGPRRPRSSSSCSSCRQQKRTSSVCAARNFSRQKRQPSGCWHTLSKNASAAARAASVADGSPVTATARSKPSSMDCTSLNDLKL